MSTSADNAGQEPLPTALQECLSIDLEVDAKTARINALAAWRPYTGERLTTRNGPLDTGEASKGPIPVGAGTYAKLQFTVRHRRRWTRRGSTLCLLPPG